MENNKQIEVNEAQLEIGWYRAMFRDKSLIVHHKNGQSETYHPPYPYPDSLAKELQNHPGAVTAVCSTHAFELANSKLRPKSIAIVSHESRQVYDYWKKNGLCQEPSVGEGFCIDMIYQYSPAGVALWYQKILKTITENFSWCRIKSGEEMLPAMRFSNRYDLIPYIDIYASPNAISTWRVIRIILKYDSIQANCNKYAENGIPYCFSFEYNSNEVTTKLVQLIESYVGSPVKLPPDHVYSGNY